jgi:iron complex outermembrane receptor protein
MFHPKTKKTLMSVAVAGALGLMNVHAYAQQAAADTTTDTTDPKKLSKKESNEIQEVNITATRYSTSLLKTPLAVTAFNQESLARMGVTSAKDLANEIPNVTIVQSNDSAIQVTIRGITSSNTTEIGDPAVGFHVDGLYSPRPQGAQALMFDVEQVEVLRGPQGTLFGRNSTGGTINVISAKPDFTGNYGHAEAELGNYNKRQFNVVQNFKVSDDLAFRAALMKVTRDGFANQMQDFSEANVPAHGWVPDGIPDVMQRWNRKVEPKNYYTNQNEWAARLSAVYKINKDLKLHATYEEFQDSSAGGTAFKDCESTAGTRYACPAGWGRFDLKINVPGVTDMKIRTLRSGVNWNVDNDTVLDYNFALADQRRSQLYDNDKGNQTALPFQVTQDNPNIPGGNNWGTWPLSDQYQQTVDSKYVSTVQELQLKQRIGSLKYVAGLFWMHEKNQINYEVIDLYRAPVGLASGAFYAQPDRQVDAKAAFAQADWEFAPTWTATAGARFSSDSKTDKDGLNLGGWWGQKEFYNGGFDPGTPNTPGYHLPQGHDLDYGPGGSAAAYHLYGTPSKNDHEEKWHKLTWRLGLQTQINKNEMAYASLSTGYKAGGFGDRVMACGGDSSGPNMRKCAGGVPNVETFLPYKPELVTNFELGYKGKFLDDTLSLSAVAFAMDYKDQQLTGTYFVSKYVTPAPCTSDQPKCDVYETWRTINVGNTKIRGLEVEWDYKPWPGGKIGGAFTLLDTKIHDYGSYSDDYNCDARVEFGQTPCPTPYAGIGPDNGKRLYDVTNNSLPNAPKHTFMLHISQKFDLPSGYSVTPYIKWNWRDKAYFDVRNDEFAVIGRFQKAYALTDASVRLDAPNDAWHAELFVRNATDSHAAYWRGAGIGAQMNYAPVEPRMFGARFGFSY